MEKGFDTDQSFMLVEVAGDKLYFQTVSRSGRMIDSGSWKASRMRFPDHNGRARATPKRKCVGQFAPRTVNDLIAGLRHLGFIARVLKMVGGAQADPVASCAPQTVVR